MELPVTSWVLFGLAAIGMFLMVIEWVFLRRLRRERLPDPPSWPGISVLRPLCGLDDDLKENIESLLQVDYPGPFEIILGVRTEQDLAFPVARQLADAHPDRVRLVLQQGEPGHNPKVNQLIGMSRVAKHEIIAVSDSNVRVAKSFLREHAAALALPNVGVSSHFFIGVGEERFGAALDNLTLASFCAPNLVGGLKIARLDHVVGKSLAIRRTVLESVGGWHSVKDVLAEDQQLSTALAKAGLRSWIGSTPVYNVQRTQSLAQFWGRHTRWAMIRFRVPIVAVIFEPFSNPLVVSLVAAAFAPASPTAWLLCLFAALFSIAYTQACAVTGRGHGFALHHLLLVPLRDLMLFAMWLRGSTMRWVNWRGNRLQVLAKTRLAAPVALARVRNMQKLGRD